MAGSLFRTKSIDRLMSEAAATGEGTLKRTLGPMSLVALGIGAIIGAGLAGIIYQRAGHAWPFLTCAILLALACVVTVFFRPGRDASPASAAR